MGRRKGEYYKKKRVFKGNQHSQSCSDKSDRSTTCGVQSASARKLNGTHSPSNQTVHTVNIIVDVNIMINELQRCLRCTCGETVNISFDRISGLGCKFSIVYKKCLEIGSFSNSSKLGKNNNIISINRHCLCNEMYRTGVG